VAIHDSVQITPPSAKRTTLILESPKGVPFEVEAPWPARLRPWRFRHTDGRYFEASREEQGKWIYRTYELAPSDVEEHMTLHLTQGIACCLNGDVTIPTRDVQPIYEHLGVLYKQHCKYSDGSLHYHHA
jgi:hypothetical protein